MKVTISKGFERKISRDYTSWGFQTGLTLEMEIEKPESIKEASDLVFDMVRFLTEKDIEKTLPGYLAEETAKLSITTQSEGQEEK